MSLLNPSIVIAIWVSSVQARSETLTHGWIPEPQGRGTWSILWSCLATIFICTWSALHLDVPNRRGKWYLLFRKPKYMLVAAAAPEYILFEAAQKFFESRDLLKNLVGRGNKKWTLTHMQFACAGGFRTCKTKEGDISECSEKQLYTLIENKSIDGPSISEEELQARGKSDLVVKLIAILQIIWFVVQTLFRAIKHYQVTAIEIMTVAFVFCSVFTYCLTLHQPQDVVYPVILDIRTITPATGATTLEGVSDKPNQAREDAEPPTHRLERVRSGLRTQYVAGWAAGYVPPFLLVLFASGFGALHCLAWNSPFPTSEERLAWRVCSVTTTALPAVLTLESSLFPRRAGGILSDLELRIGLVIIGVYTIGRVTIVVLAFMTLRALPADAFKTVNWNNYIPHFAA